MRRAMTLLLAALPLAFGSVLASDARSARAGEWWCWDDPVLVVNGLVLNVYPGVPSSARTSVTLAEVTVTVPEGVDASLTATTSSYFPVTARLVRKGRVGADDSITVTVSTVLWGAGSFDAGLKLSQPGGSEGIVYGHANQTITNSYTLTQPLSTGLLQPASSGLTKPTSTGTGGTTR